MTKKHSLTFFRVIRLQLGELVRVSDVLFGGCPSVVRLTLPVLIMVISLTAHLIA